MAQDSNGEVDLEHDDAQDACLFRRLSCVRRRHKRQDADGHETGICIHHTTRYRLYLIINFHTLAIET